VETAGNAGVVGSPKGACWNPFKGSRRVIRVEEALGKTATCSFIPVHSLRHQLPLDASHTCRHLGGTTPSSPSPLSFCHGHHGQTVVDVMHAQEPVRLCSHVALLCWFSLAVCSPVALASSMHKNPSRLGGRRLHHQGRLAVAHSPLSGSPAAELSAPGGPDIYTVTGQQHQQQQQQAGSSGAALAALPLLESSAKSGDEQTEAAAQAAVYTLLQQQGQLQGSAAEPAAYKVISGSDARQGRQVLSLASMVS
jgi:hypothetical protein